MTIAQYVRLLRQQWLLVALITLAGTAGASAFTFLQTPTYQASTQLFVSASNDSSDISQLSQAGTFTQQRVKSYIDLVSSPRVLQPVIDQLQLGVTPQHLAERVTATSPLDTVLIDITVTDTAPDRARDTADAIAAQFPALVSLLETRSVRTISPVTVSITRRAVSAAEPTSPKRSLNLALGLLVGLGLGVGAAVLRDTLDRSVTSPQQVTHATEAPVLGIVGEDATVAKTPLITVDGFSPRAEAFRHLRTNIRFLSVDHRLHSLVVTGSVAAEGKTTTAANLAIALAQSGEPVVLIDADLRRPTVADLFGLSSGVGLTSVLLGELDLDGALQTWHHGMPLRVLTSGPLPPNPSELIGSSRMAQVIEKLTASGSTVVIDSPPLLPVTDAAVLARVTDGALVVTRVGSTHIDQLTSAVGILRTAGATVLGVVLNRVPRRGTSGYGDGYGTDTGYHSYAADSSKLAAQAEPAPPAGAAGPAGAESEPFAPAPVSRRGRVLASAERVNVTPLTAPRPVTVVDLSAVERHAHPTDSDRADSDPAFSDEGDSDPTFRDEASGPRGGEYPDLGGYSDAGGYPDIGGYPGSGYETVKQVADRSPDIYRPTWQWRNGQPGHLNGSSALGNPGDIAADGTDTGNHRTHGQD